MSEYNNEETYGIKNFFQVLAKRISINGFIQGDLVAKYGLQPFVDEYLPLVETGKHLFTLPSFSSGISHLHLHLHLHRYLPLLILD